MFEMNQNVHTMNFGDYRLVCNAESGSYIKLPETYFKAMMSFDFDEEIMKQHIDLYKIFCILIQQQFIVKKGLHIQNGRSLDTVYFSVTNKCNLSCIHCCTNADLSYNDILSTEIVFQIIDKIIELKPKVICFTGGEPMIREDIVHILQYARSKFEGNIILSTNGTLIHPGNIEDIIKYVNSIAISLDGYDEKSSSILRGEGIFSKSCNAVEILHRHNFYNISLSMVLTKYTKEKKEKFEELCEKYEAKAVIRILQPLGRGKKIYIEYGMKSLVNEDELSIGCRTCFPGKKELHISFDGNVYPCGGTFGIEEFVIANILDPDFIKIIKEQLLINDLSCLSTYRSWSCKNCEKCSVQLFCPICLGEKSVLIKENCLEEQFCAFFKTKMERLLERELLNG